MERRLQVQRTGGVKKFGAHSTFYLRVYECVRGERVGHSSRTVGRFRRMISRHASYTTRIYIYYERLRKYTATASFLSLVIGGNGKNYFSTPLSERDALVGIATGVAWSDLVTAGAVSK